MSKTAEFALTRDDRINNALAAFGPCMEKRGLSGTWIGTRALQRPSRYRQMIGTTDPTTSKIFASVSVTDEGGYNGTMAVAAEAFRYWRASTAKQRCDLMTALAEAFTKYQEPLAVLVSAEMGKILAESRGEVQEAIDIFRFAAGLARQLGGPGMLSERPYHRMYEQWHPLGVIGVITAFNFPVAVWSWNAALAAVCGNTVVWKGSELTPLVSVAVHKICAEVMENLGTPAIFSLVTGGREVGEWMAKDTDIPLVSFTGSCKAGREVAQVVAGRFGKYLLELGGNNAIIAHKDANIDLLVRAVLFGAFGTAGQRCTTTRRLIVHEDIAGDVCTRLVQACRQIKIGDPLAEGTLMGPLITPDSVQRMHDACTEAFRQGGRVLPQLAYPIDGQRDLFVPPVIIPMPSQTAIVKEETFAPILYVMTYKGEVDEAIAMNNDVSQGLSSAIFTRDMQVGERFLSAMGSDCGIANWNIGTSGAEIGGAFGGEKATGGGRESGSDSWKQYMRRQTCTVNYGNALPLAQGITFDVKPGASDKTEDQLTNERIMKSVAPGRVDQK